MEDPSGRVTSYDYVENDDYLKKVTLDGDSVTYDYTAGNLLKKISSPKTTYSFGYDSFGNVTKFAIGSDPDASGSITLAENTYNNNNGNLKNTVYGNGFKIGYSYDNYDRVTTVYHNGTTKFKWSYGADGQVGRHEDKINGKNYQYTYDLAGRLLRTDISD